MKQYGKETFQIFYITDCKYCNNNKENQSGYKFVIFSCYKHSEPKSRVNQQRETQTYSGSNCKAYIRIVKKEAGDKKDLYYISKINTQQNHPITDAAFYCHHSNRKLPIELQEQAKTSLKTGSQPALVAEHLSELTGQIITGKDLHNINNPKQSTKKNPTQLVQEVLDKQIQKDKTPFSKPLFFF